MLHMFKISTVFKIIWGGVYSDPVLSVENGQCLQIYMQQQIADVLVSIFLNISKISMNITYLKIRSGHLILILVISSYIYQFFTIISKIPYILVASGSLHQLFLCKSDEFLFSRTAGEKKHSDRGFLKELLLPLSSLDSYLRSGTARKFFDAAHSGSWVVAD